MSTVARSAAAANKPLLHPPGHDDPDREVTRITAPHQKTARKARAQRSKTSLSTYYPSGRRSKSMWREGVNFSTPSPARFQLPCLPSIGDLNPGMRDLEVWPSGAKSGAGASGDKAGGSKLSKPKLLLELESFVDKQLFLIQDQEKDQLVPVGFNLDQFQVWRNVFEFFIERLHTYRPLLSGIRHEYELVLEDYITRLNGVTSMQAELDELEGGAAEELAALESKHQAQIDELEKTSGGKDLDIQRLINEEKKLASEISGAEQEIGHIEDRRLKVHQSNVALCGSLQFYEDWLQSFTRPENYEVMLKQSQAEFTVVLEELQKLKKACVDKVAREDLDQLLEDARVLREKLRIRQLDVQNFKTIIEKTHKNCDLLQVEVDKLEAQVTGLTPRPMFDIAQYSSAPTAADTNSKVLALARTVKVLNSELEDLRDQMPDELQSDDEEEEQSDDWVHQEEFTGRGFGEDVPKYLQWDGSIRNRGLSKRDTEMLIKNFWREKDKADAKRNGPKQRIPVHDWMYDFLVGKYTKPDMVTEMAYNLLDAALKFKYDADCEMFLRVMTNELDELVYWEEFEMMDGLMQLLHKLDMADNSGKVTGKLPKSTLLKALRKWFPSKSDIRFNKLKRCLSKEDAAKGNTVHYVHLFAEDKDFNQGPFAEMVRDQHADERSEYLSDLELALEEQAGRSGVDVTASQCLDGIREMDPKKPQKARESYVLRGFRLPKSTKIPLDSKISVETFLVNLSRGVVKTHSKRDEIEVDTDVAAASP